MEQLPQDPFNDLSAQIDRNPLFKKQQSAFHENPFATETDERTYKVAHREISPPKEPKPSQMHRLSQRVSLTIKEMSSGVTQTKKSLMDRIKSTYHKALENASSYSESIKEGVREGWESTAEFGRGIGESIRSSSQNLSSRFSSKRVSQEGAAQTEVPVTQTSKQEVSQQIEITPEAERTNGLWKKVATTAKRASLGAGKGIKTGAKIVNRNIRIGSERAGEAIITGTHNAGEKLQTVRNAASIGGMIIRGSWKSATNKNKAPRYGEGAVEPLIETKEPSEVSISNKGDAESKASISTSNPTNSENEIQSDSATIKQPIESGIVGSGIDSTEGDTFKIANRDLIERLCKGNPEAVRSAILMGIKYTKLAKDPDLTLFKLVQNKLSELKEDIESSPQTKADSLKQITNLMDFLGKWVEYNYNTIEFDEENRKLLTEIATRCISSEEAQVRHLGSTLQAIIYKAEDSLSKEVNGDYQPQVGEAFIGKSAEEAKGLPNSMDSIISSITAGKIKAKQYAELVETVSQDLTNQKIQLLLAISSNELILGKWANKDVPGPNVLSILNLDQRTTQYVVDLILSLPDNDRTGRIKLFNFIIDVANKCIERRDYDTALALQRAIDHTAVTRLINNKKLNLEYSKKHSALNFLFDPEGNFKNLRGVIQERIEGQVSFIPCMTLYQRDFTFLNETEIIASNGLYNYKQPVILDQKLRAFDKTKELAQKEARKASLTDICARIKEFRQTDDSNKIEAYLYNRSNEILPRGYSTRMS